MNNLDEIVEECIKQHKGGERFFDALDEKIRNNKSLLHLMIEMILSSNIKFDYIIVSGKFGKVFDEFTKNEYSSLNIITVNGSLRIEENVVNHEKIDLENKKIIFVDDSYYSGGTKKKVEDFINFCRGKLISTFVFYDGGKEKDLNVHSMYRYYE